MRAGAIVETVQDSAVLRASPRWWMRSPGGPLLAIIGVKVALTLGTDNRYGYHREELYYAVTAHRLAFGYVDFPPVTPLVARLAQALFATSLVGFRAPALAAGVGVVLLTAAMAKELGGLLAGAIAAPNLAWQVAHGWPSISFLRGQNARVRGDNPTTKYITDQLFTLGPFVLVVCGAGALRLWHGARERALALAAVTVEIVYLVLRGKGYYPLDVFPILIAAGAVSVATWRRRRVVAIGLVVWAVVGLPISLPVLPENTMIRANIDKARDDFSAELGWPTVVASIAHAYREVPEGPRSQSLILTQNYSQASAVKLLSGRIGLPQAYSGHNTYWLWLPAHASIDSVVAVGFTKAELQRWFARLTLVGAVPDDRHVDVEERDVQIYWCTKPRLTTAQLWSAVKLFT